MATTFERDSNGGFSRGFTYSRWENPNRTQLEACLAALEGGTEAIAFASGMAAQSAVIQSLAPGDHIVAPDDIYHGLRTMLKEVFAPWGIRVSFVDMGDPANIVGAIEASTRLIWTETPSNPLLKITDLVAVAEIARQAGLVSVCDSTFATPILQHPFDLGIDVVMHSTTKYIAGHSDVMGGVLIGREQIGDKAGTLLERARRSQQIAGAVPSPFDCWLTLRGIETLPLRVRAQSDSAMQVAEFLQSHAAVEKVHYPGLPTQPGHAVAARQMNRFGGMLSFLVRGGATEAIAVATALQVFTRATSLGGTHSLVEHRASIEGPLSRTPQNLLRLSIGLENTADLLDDLTLALENVGV
jgi:cystathionine gamma-synthase